ncbi:aldolase/citrate lyase family protein [Fusobacterium sp. MFO224]|uniref:aldolase/citrate lyase family protein n=1 Tax=Fusobacterium sp. MFO224 TaxID=3378070 RepID=UPI003854A831
MALKLMYITNEKEIAKIAEKSGVDLIFIDLEINGKEERQKYSDTVISRHSIGDIRKIKSVLHSSKVLVRINPIYEGSKEEIEEVIEGGADIIMLPFFKNILEVEKFLEYVNGRTKTCLLLETPEAVESIDDILNLKGIDCIHIGLNDLHLGYKLKFMFELLSNGLVEKLCDKFKRKGITYGFGGIAQLGKGNLSSEYIIGEHYRLGSNMVILSRSFCNLKEIKNVKEVQEIFFRGVRKIRNYEKSLKNKDKEFFNNNKNKVEERINKILKG